MPEFTRMVEPKDEREHTVFASARSTGNRDQNVRVSLGSIADKGSISEIITPGEAKALWVVLGNYLVWAENSDAVEIDPNGPVGFSAQSLPLNSHED